MSFKIKDSFQVGTVIVSDATGLLLVPNETSTTIALGGSLTTGSLNLAAAGTGATTINIGHTNANTTLTGYVKLPTVGTSGLVRLNAGGNLTADSTAYLSSETDTLSSVTARGNTTTHPLTTTNATTSTTTGTGALIVTGGAGIGGNLFVGTNGNFAGNLVALNGNLGNLAKANFFQGDGYLLTNLTIGAGTSIVNGTSNVSVAVNGNVTIGVAGNAAIVTVTGLGANVAGYANVTGNINAGNIAATNHTGTTVNVTGQLITTVATSTAPLVVTSTTRVPNLNVSYANVSDFEAITTASTGNYYITMASAITGNIAQVGNAAILANLTSGTLYATKFVGDGGLLSNMAPTNSIANGTSNVAIVASGGNVNTSVGAVANVFVVTTTGANLAGTLNATGNANTGNLGTGIIVATGNVTGVNFMGIHANGTSNVNMPAVNGNINLSVGGTANVLVVTGTGANIAGTVNATGNVIIGGNLWVNGTTEYTNVTTTYIVDPIIELGGGANGAALGSNDAKDRGTLLHYYTTTPVDAFMGWDNGNAEFAFGSNVTVAAEVVTYNSFGNVRASYFLGNGSQLTGLNTNMISNGTSNVAIVASGGNVTVGVAGNAAIVTVTGTGANVAGYVNATGNVTGLNLIGSHANGTSNVNMPAVNGNVNVTVGGTANVLVITATGANVAGTFNATGNIIGGNISATNHTGTTVNVTGQLISTISTGTAPFVVNSTTTVANLAAATAGSATTAGTVTTAAQPNITSVGTLTGLTSSGAVSITNTTETTSNATGALQVAGGAVVNKSLWVQGSIIESTLSGVKLAETDALQTSMANGQVATIIDQWPLASYRSSRSLVQMTQGTNYQVSEVMIIHQGTVVSFTEYGVLETNGVIGNLVANVTSGNMTLWCTMAGAAATTVNLVRTAITV